MTNKEEQKCHGIIHAAAGSAATVAALSAQIPCADSVALSVIEMGMICALGEVFGKHIDKSGQASLLAGQIGTLGGRFASKLLVGWIPGIGNIANAVTAAGIVETLGWTFAEAFDLEREAAQKAARRMN